LEVDIGGVCRETVSLRTHLPPHLQGICRDPGWPWQMIMGYVAFGIISRKRTNSFIDTLHHTWAVFLFLLMAIQASIESKRVPARE
jgi:hypothetical protein